jgi:hypothetical protein
MQECRIYCQRRGFDGLRYRQRRGRRGHARAGHGDDGADRAIVVGVLIRIVAGRWRLLRGRYRRRSMCRDRMEMAERKHTLHGEREQRHPCAMLDVRPKPLHVTPRAESRYTPWPRRYNITSQARRLDVNCPRRETIREFGRSAAARRDQRPSRSQVAANAPSSSNRPIRPANTGNTPTPLTTLASRIFTPNQPSPRKILEA